MNRLLPRHNSRSFTLGSFTLGLLAAALVLATSAPAWSQEKQPKAKQPPATKAKPAAPKVPDSVVYERDVQYGAAGDRALKLDVVRPRAESKEPRPVVVWIHGGGWSGGDKSSGLNLLIGKAGLFSVTQALFYGLGAYATAILTVHYGWSWDASVLPGMLVAMLVAVLISAVSLRPLATTMPLRCTVCRPRVALTS